MRIDNPDTKGPRYWRAAALGLLGGLAGAGVVELIAHLAQ